MPPPPPPPPPRGRAGGRVPAGRGTTPGIGATLGYAWHKYTQNLGSLLIAMLVPTVVSVFHVVVRRQVNSAALGLVVSVVGFVVQAVASIGVYRVALQIVNGEQADVAKAFRYDRWGEWVTLLFVFGLIAALGLMLCIVPGILALGFFGLAPYFFLDRRQRIGDALSSSRSSGLWVPVLVVSLVGAAGFFVGSLGSFAIAPSALAGVGGFFLGSAVSFVTAPIAHIGRASLYKHATGKQHA